MSELSIPDEYEPDAAAAHELRLAGTSWPKIVRELGYATPEHAQVAVYTWQRKQLIAADDNRRAVALATELERIDTIQASWWAAATGGIDVLTGVGILDEKAANVVLKCIALRAKLLGLDTPVAGNARTEHTVTVIKGDSDVYIESLKQVIGES